MFSFIPYVMSPWAQAGEIVLRTYNPFGGSHNISKGVANAEKGLLNFLGQQMGYEPKPLGGLFLSGGSMSTLTASIIARNKKLAEEEYAIGTAYVSDQSHSSAKKGLKIMGLMSENIRKVPTDANFRMKLDVLEDMIQEDIEAGKKPFLVIGTAGTTNTGSVDEMATSRSLCLMAVPSLSVKTSKI